MRFNRFYAVVLSIIFAPAFLFAANANLRATLEPGLQRLFEGQISSSEIDAIVQEAGAFKDQYDLSLQKLPQSLQNVRFEKKSAQVLQFSVPSLVERPGHPSNVIRGEIYFPVNFDRCQANYPATLLLHHVGDDIKPEQILAQMASAENRGIVMLIYLPDYGPRRNGKESFITNDFGQFQRNLLQALLDTRLAYEILKRQQQVDTQNMKLMGISLGGILSLMSAGLDPVFDQYAILVGGGDLAHILAHRKDEDPNSETGQALKDIHWTQDEARRKLAPVDSLTWAGNVHGKKIVLMNAKDDELIDPRLGVEKIAQLFQAGGNQVEVRFHSGGHRPDVKAMGVMTFLKSIYFPTMAFMSAGKSPICD